MNLKQRLAIEWITIGLVATALITLLILWRGTSAFDNVLYDRLSAAAPAQPDPEILIIAIDDPSLKALGKWPWDRSLHGQLIEKMHAAKARSISLDILLSEPSNPAADKALANAMAGAPAVIPLHFVSPGSDGQTYDTLRPIAPLSQAANAVGHVNVSFDNDGIVRRAALCFRPDPGGPAWPHLMELAYRQLSTKPSAAFARSKSCGSELLIPFTRRGAFTEISYADALNGLIPDGFVEGHDVIIGATAAGLGDNFPVPSGDGGLLSGAEIMANMLGALRRDDFIAPLGTGWIIVLSLFPAWLLLLGFLRWRPRAVLVMSLSMIAAILLTSAGLLVSRIWFPPGAALLGVLLIYPLWGWRRLQAMSDFMGSELGALEKEGEATRLPIKQSQATDWAGKQSEALAGAIGQMRDLRRFVSDTLADLPDPMFVTNPEGTVTLTNRLLDDRLGKPISGMTMTSALDQMVAPEQRSQVDRYIASRSGHRQDTGNTDAEFVRFVSPLARTFVMRRSEVRSEAGVLHGHIHYLTDISALAQAEAEREEVLQLLSHDMRAPQSTIIALLSGDVDADAKKRIEHNARRTMQLAQDFVEMARMAETEFDGEDVLLADLVREVADNYWPLAKERDINIVLSDQSDYSFVLAEPDMLSRAIGNLIDNAIKFSPDGGTIEIDITRTADDVSVSILDHGKGIEPSILPRLFTRFATDGNQKGRAKGTGLGLTFVDAVIARHKGRIEATNVKGEGARFVVSLPKAPEETAL
jgi:CHASE2 domain-containing sensor protein/signal transduction histidine kinase